MEAASECWLDLMGRLEDGTDLATVCCVALLLWTTHETARILLLQAGGLAPRCITAPAVAEEVAATREWDELVALVRRMGGGGGSSSSGVGGSNDGGLALSEDGETLEAAWLGIKVPARMATPLRAYKGAGSRYSLAAVCFLVKVLGSVCLCVCVW